MSEPAKINPNQVVRFSEETRDVLTMMKEIREGINPCFVRVQIDAQFPDGSKFNASEAYGKRVSVKSV